MTRATTLESLSQTVASNYAEQQESTMQLRASMTGLEDKFTELFNLLTKNSVAPTIADPNQIPMTSANQVHTSTSEPDRSIRIEEVRVPNALSDYREMMKRVELPIFDGEDAYGWIAVAERFFRMGEYDEMTKMRLVSVSLKGDVLSWFNSEILRRPFETWIEFKQRLIARFSRVKLRDPSQPFFAVRQTGSVSEYIHQFEDLSTQASGVSDTQREGIFMNGLTEEMREVVTMCKPVDLPDMIATAYQMEDSSLFSVIQKEVKLRKVKGGGAVNTTSKSYSSYVPTSSWKQKQAMPSTTTTTPTQQNNVKPAVRLSEEQVAEKRRLGLCFKCDAKWSRQHLVNGVCPNASLRVLTIWKGMEMELIDQEDKDGETEEIIWEPQLKTLSLQSFFGKGSPTTTKLIGSIKKRVMLVMLDSGATHNFISPKVAAQLKLITEEGKGYWKCCWEHEFP